MINTQTRVGLLTEFPDFNTRGFNVDEYNLRFKDANFIISAKSKGISFPPHWSPLSIKCSWHGSEYYKSGNALYAVDPTNYLLFNEGRYYSSWIDSATDVHSFTMSFTPAFENQGINSLLSSTENLLDDPFQSKPHNFTFNEKLYQHDNRVTPIILTIHKLISTLNESGERLQGCFALLLEKLVERQFEINQQINDVQKLRLSTKTELYRRLHRARDFIYSSYNRELKVCEMADVACLNQFYFLRQFKKIFRCTPHQFLNQRRLTIASSLLKTTDKSITEVCIEIGFRDVASFSKLFKRTYGASPTGYRRTS